MMSNQPATFTISIERWATEFNMHKLPICEISSDTKIRNALQDYDVFSAESLVIRDKGQGQYSTSFIFWSASRVHCDIGDVIVIMVNLGDRVGILLYSKTTSFVVDNNKAINKSGVWHSFAVLEGEESVEVKVG